MQDEPAFPCECFDPEYGMDKVKPGLTKREWFAGMALQGIMANPERWKQIADDYKFGKKTYQQCSEANVAKAVNLADALIAALKETDNG